MSNQRVTDITAGQKFWCGGSKFEATTDALQGSGPWIIVGAIDEDGDIVTLELHNAGGVALA